MDRYIRDSLDENKMQQTGSFAIEGELRKTIQRQKKTIFRLAERNKLWKLVCLILLVLLIIESVVLGINFANDNVVVPTADTEQNQQNSSEVITVPTTIAEVEADDTIIQEILLEMTIEEKINQLMFVTPEALCKIDNVTRAGDATRDALNLNMVGGLIYSSPNFESKQQLTEMITNVNEYSKVSPFIATSEISGADSELKVIKNDSDFKLSTPSEISAYKSQNLMVSDYYKNAEFMYKLGFNTNFGPDIIKGSNVLANSTLASAIVLGYSKYGISSVISGFPETTDTGKTIEQLEENEFEIFASAIDSGCDFIIMSNAFNSNLLSGDVPYSMSESVISDILVSNLKFNGIVVSNALSDKIVTDKYTYSQIVVNCLNAGNNMFICTSGLDEAVTAIREAVRNGEISENLIDESVKKILSVKIKRGIIK